MASHGSPSVHPSTFFWWQTWPAKACDATKTKIDEITIFNNDFIRDMKAIDAVLVVNIRTIKNKE